MSTQIILSITCFLTLCASKTVTIDNTKPMLDVHGKIINVHEGHIVRWEPDGDFYFYGMQYDLCPDTSIKCGCKNGVCPCGWQYDHNVSVYTSTDLSSGSWKYNGTVFDTTTVGRPNGTYFRTFIFHNNQTKKYILWNMVHGQYISSEADHPLGPFTIKHINIQMGHS
eukprot:104045_1